MQTRIAPNPSLVYAQPALMTTPGMTNGNAFPVPLQPSTSKIDRLPTRQTAVLGSTQVVCGILCIIFNSVGIALYAELTFIAHGIWCGCIFIVAGGIGIGAAYGKTKCLIVSFMVLSIIAACFAPIVLIISAIGLSEDVNGCRNGYWDDHLNEWICMSDSDAIAMNAMLVFTSLVEGIAAILSAIVCCRAYCCCRDKAKNASMQQCVVVYVAKDAAGNPTVVSTQRIPMQQPIQLQQLQIQQPIQLQQPVQIQQPMQLQQPIPEGVTSADANQAGAPPQYGTLTPVSTDANQAGAPPQYGTLTPVSTDECFKQPL